MGVFRKGAEAAALIFLLTLAPAARPEEARAADNGGQWRLLKSFKGEFAGGANTSGAWRDKLEAAAHRHVRFAIPAPARLRVEYFVDKNHVPEGWPKDVALTPDIHLDAVLKEPGGKQRRFTAARRAEFDAPANSVLTLHINQDTFDPGYKTFYPARWRVDVRYRPRESGQAPPVPGGMSDGAQAATPVTVPPADAPAVAAPECGEAAECARTPEPQAVEGQGAPEEAGASSAPPPAASMTAAKPPAAGPAALADGGRVDKLLDLAFWNSVKDSDNPKLLRAYLEKFPRGVFAVIARERLKALARRPGARDPASGERRPAMTVPGFFALYRKDPEAALAAAEREEAKLRMAVQKRLLETCVYDGAVDGVFGPATQRALAAFAASGGESVCAPSDATRAAGLVLTAHGLGPISAGTPYDRAALKKLLPGYDIRQETYEAEGETYKRISAYKDGKRAIDFEGEKIVSGIFVLTPEIGDANGVYPGMTLAQLRKSGKMRGRECFSGADESAGVVFCTRGGAVDYAFSHPSFARLEADHPVAAARMPGTARVRVLRWISQE